MTITLPDEMKNELERKARAAGFTSVDEYVFHALRDRPDEHADDLRDMPVPGELEIKSQEDLEAKILEGLNSGPPIRVTPEFWTNLRRRAEDRANSQKQQP
jgi:antitoxin ParD1/3/4